MRSFQINAVNERKKERKKEDTMEKERNKKKRKIKRTMNKIDKLIGNKRKKNEKYDKNKAINNGRKIRSKKKSK